MKKLLLILMMFIGILGYSQEIKSHYITETDSIGFITKAGSCGSPDGPSTETLIVPPNYQYLEDNGYCLYSYSTTSTFTACFTFVAGSSLVDVNAGHSQSCNQFTFSNFRLFNSSCVQIATGLSFTGLVPGETYTWCLNMRAWGGGGCNGFSTFCPYFLNIVDLPISLSHFSVINYKDINIIRWETESEQNNDFFTIEHSSDGKNWRDIVYIPGAGNSSSSLSYEYQHTAYPNEINYYRLRQTDYDGTTVVFNVTSIDNRKNKQNLVRTINTMGQEVDEKYNGIIIKLYSDGSIEKIWR
jgi:hypothetical protein